MSVICFGLALFATFVAFRPDLAGPEFDPTDVRVVMAGTALLCAAGPFISARRTYIHCTKCDARWRR